ncbi:hypothetical protein B0H10DRAFT_2224447 [Mycena sp. CBHHK59/15]|nr:hypothetical protein B0H10DRAFT_2224447 [Mycena sp. CBHHK59/15]
MPPAATVSGHAPHALRILLRCALHPPPTPSPRPMTSTPTLSADVQADAGLLDAAVRWQARPSVSDWLSAEDDGARSHFCPQSRERERPSAHRVHSARCDRQRSRKRPIALDWAHRAGEGPCAYRAQARRLGRSSRRRAKRKRPRAQDVAHSATRTTSPSCRRSGVERRSDERNSVALAGERDSAQDDVTAVYAGALHGAMTLHERAGRVEAARCVLLERSMPTQLCSRNALSRQRRSTRGSATASETTPTLRRSAALARAPERARDDSRQQLVSAGESSPRGSPPRMLASFECGMAGTSSCERSREIPSAGAVGGARRRETPRVRALCRGRHRSREISSVHCVRETRSVRAEPESLAPALEGRVGQSALLPGRAGPRETMAYLPRFGCLRAHESRRIHGIGLGWARMYLPCHGVASESITALKLRAFD